MEKPLLDRFFYYASRFVIVFPIIVLAFTLLFVKSPSKTAEIARVPTPVEQEPVLQKNEQIDLNASYICKVNTEKKASVEAYLKNKSLFVKTQERGTTKYTLFKRDCLYSWQTNKLTGMKTCGLSQYVSMAENLSNFNMLNSDSLMQTFLGDKNLPSVSQACKKQEIKEDKLFEIPKNINFKEEK